MKCWAAVLLLAIAVIALVQCAPRRLVLGLGKRSATFDEPFRAEHKRMLRARMAYGLGKRSPRQRIAFGIGKRGEAYDDEGDEEDRGVKRRRNLSNSAYNSHNA